MSPVARTALIVVGVVAAAGLLVTGAMRMVERQQTAGEINRLREELYRARAASDRCRSSLANSESALQELTSAIDSLRGEVQGYQTAAGGGVPAARYDEYLELFESYNDSVEVWEARERRLRAAEESCRATIQTHNALSDSLQRVLADAGIEAG